MNKEGIFDLQCMVLYFFECSNDEWLIFCEMVVVVVREVLQCVGCSVVDIDGVIVVCFNLQCVYLVIVVEVQVVLGIQGYGYDMNVVCFLVIFGIQVVIIVIQIGQVWVILMVNLEICIGYLNFCDCDSYFIFGDVCIVVIVECVDLVVLKYQFDIVSIRLLIQFFNNICNNFGFFNCVDESGIGKCDKLFVQEGCKVFKDVCLMVVELIGEYLVVNEIQVVEVKCFWLYQVNLNMNLLIICKLFGCDVEVYEVLVIFDSYVNISFVGLVIVLYKYQDDLFSGVIGVFSLFGVGYLIGSVILCKY